MVKKKLLERSIEQLIDLGKKKGYLTYDEINHFISEEITNVKFFDHQSIHFYHFFSRNGGNGDLCLWNVIFHGGKLSKTKNNLLSET